jgi:tetratricopeptide (TPR) repeat protein
MERPLTETDDRRPAPDTPLSLTPLPDGSTGDDPPPTGIRQFIDRLDALARPAETTDLAPSSPPAGCPAVPGYAVLGEIARGGMGRVLAARDLAFGRDVAVKVLLTDHPAGAARFVREALITGRLQHPGIPAAHHLGQLADGNPFLAMKLVRGKTLAELLGDRPPDGEDLPRWVGVFEQVCQAVGYAHSQGVMHRDLKPANVMVGAFGEVQVMDWGLAKNLAVEARETPGPGLPPGAHDPSPYEPVTTQAGSVMGTLSYMAPEQARGEPVDARADVFGLGGILCEILSGRPPFTGTSRIDVLRNASDGNLSEAFARLDRCAADAELVALCRRLLAPVVGDRPADGGEAAGLAAAYRAGVEDRLRLAERDRAAAAAREAEGRKKRRWQRAATAAAGLLLAAGGAFAWWDERQAGERRAEVIRRQAEDRTREDTERAARAENGRVIAAHLARCRDALGRDDAEAAAVALDEVDRRIPAGGGDHLRPEAQRYRTALAVLEALDATDDRRFGVGVRARETSEANEEGWRGALARCGIAPGVTPPAEVARLVNGSPIRDRLLITLDHWLIVSRSPDLLAILRAADPDPFRDDFRAAVQRGDDAGVRELAGRAAAVAGQPARFAAAMGHVGAIPTERQRSILEAALLGHPSERILLILLGSTYPSDPATAPAREKWFRAAVAARPNTAAAWVMLGGALRLKGDLAGAESCYRRAVRLVPGMAVAHGGLGDVLSDRGDVAGAVASYRESVRLDPGLVAVHFNLGNALGTTGDHEGAVASYRSGIRADPRNPRLHHSLGRALLRTGDVDGAIASLREATRFEPGYVPAHEVLGAALYQKGDVSGAAASLREAIRLDPGCALAHANLGKLLHRAGDVDGAVASWRKAVQFGVAVAEPYYNLGVVAVRSGDLAGGVAHFRTAVRHDPRHAQAHFNLGVCLARQGDLDGAVGHLREAERLAPGAGVSRALQQVTRMQSERTAVQVAPPPREAHR